MILNTTASTTNILQHTNYTYMFQGLKLPACKLTHFSRITMQNQIKYYLQKVSLVSKLTVLHFWSCIEFLVIIQPIELLRYFIGPLPEKLCYWQQVYRSHISTEFLCQIDAKILARYIFIFWLKNPAGFHDNFCFTTDRIFDLLFYDCP